MVDQVRVRGDAGAVGEPAFAELFRVHATRNDGEGKIALEGEIDRRVRGLVGMHGDDDGDSTEDVVERGDDGVLVQLDFTVGVVAGVAGVVVGVVLIASTIRRRRDIDRAVDDAHRRPRVFVSSVSPIVRDESRHAPPARSRRDVRRSHSRFPRRVLSRVHLPRPIHSQVLRFSHAYRRGVAFAFAQMKSQREPAPEPSQAHRARIDHPHLRRVRRVHEIERQDALAAGDVQDDAAVERVGELAREPLAKPFHFLPRVFSARFARPRARRARGVGVARGVGEFTRVAVATRPAEEMATRRRRGHRRGGVCGTRRRDGETTATRGSRRRDGDEKLNEIQAMPGARR